MECFLRGSLTEEYMGVSKVYKKPSEFGIGIGIETELLCEGI